MDFPRTPRNQIGIDIGGQSILESVFIDVEALEKQLKSVTSGTCTIWVEQGPISEPRPLFLVAKIGSACVHFEMGISVQISVKPDGPFMLGHVESAERRSFLYRTVKQFIPKMKSLIKETVISKFFLDIRATNDRAIQRALMVHPIVIMAGVIRPNLFRVLACQDVFSRKIVAQSVSPKVMFPITVDMEHHVIWAVLPKPYNTVRFVSPSWTFPRPISFSSAMLLSSTPASLKWAAPSDDKPSIALVDHVLNLINGCWSECEKFTQIQNQLELFSVISPDIWLKRGAIPVLVKALACKAVDTIHCFQHTISNIMIKMTLTSENFAANLVELLLSSIEISPHSAKLLNQFLMVVSVSSVASEHAIKQQAIQRLYRLLPYLPWDSDNRATGKDDNCCGKFNTIHSALGQSRKMLATHGQKPVWQLSASEQIEGSSVQTGDHLIATGPLIKLEHSTVGFHAGQEMVYNELAALLHHVRDFKLAANSDQASKIHFVPIQKEVNFQVQSRTEQLPPAIIIRILIHLLTGLPASVACPINIGSLLNISELLVPTSSPYAQSLLADLISACDGSQSDSQLTFMEVVEQRLVPMESTSRAGDALLAITTAVIESNSKPFQRPEVLFLEAVGLFKKLTEGFLSNTSEKSEWPDQSLMTMAALIRIWAATLKCIATPTTTSLVYVHLVRDVNIFPVLVVIFRAVFSDLTHAAMTFINACFLFFRHVSKLAPILRFTPRRVQKLYSSTRCIYEFPDGLLYCLVRSLLNQCCSFRLSLLENISKILRYANNRMESVSSRFSETHAERVSYHYEAFISRYCKPDVTSVDLRICCFHAHLLLSLAETRTKSALDRFKELQVGLFLVAETSLEYAYRQVDKIIMRVVHRRQPLKKKEPQKTPHHAHSEHLAEGFNDEPENSSFTSSMSELSNQETQESLNMANKATFSQPSQPATSSIVKDDEQGGAEPNSVPGMIDSFVRASSASWASGRSMPTPAGSAIRPLTIVPRLQLKGDSIQTLESSKMEYTEELLIKEVEENRKARRDQRSSRSNWSAAAESVAATETGADNNVFSAVGDDDYDSEGDDDSFESPYDSEDFEKETILVKAIRRISAPIVALHRASTQKVSKTLTRRFGMDSNNGSSYGQFGKPQKSNSRNSLKSANTSVTIKSRMSSARVRVESTTSSIDPTNIQQQYFKRRHLRHMYKDKQLHLTMVRLLLRLMVARNQMTLSDYLCHRMPLTQLPHQINIPFIVHQHINYPANYKALADLEALEIRSGPSAHRLLRLLSLQAFHSQGFINKRRKAKGRFGSIFECQDENHIDPIAVKVIDIPFAYHDYCVVHDLFSEIAIMERFRNSSNMCHLYDYGVSKAGYQLIMPLFPMSLRQWRQEQNRNLQIISDRDGNEQPDRESSLQMLDACLAIYSDVLLAVDDLHTNFCIHFDLKCDNVLVRPLPSSGGKSNFQISLADFGESLMWNPSLGEEPNSPIGRGTENVQSPEILSLSSPPADNKRRPTSKERPQRKSTPISTPADVWATGCLLYELLTGEYLFEEKQGLPIFFQVISKSQPVVAHKHKCLLANLFGESIGTAIADFIGAVLVRNVLRRPRVVHVINMFNQLRSSIQHWKNDNLKSRNPSLQWLRFDSIRRPLSITKIKWRPSQKYISEHSVHPLLTPEVTKRSLKRVRVVSTAAALPCIFHAILDHHPESRGLASFIDTSVHRITTSCWVAPNCDISTKSFAQIRIKGIRRLVHCGVVEKTTIFDNAIGRNIIVIGGRFAGRLNSIPLSIGVSEERTVINNIARWITGFLEPCVDEIVASILEGDGILVCGQENTGPIVAVLVFLIRTYRVSLMEAILTLRQKHIVSAIDRRVMKAVLKWSVNRHIDDSQVKFSQHQYGCMCASTIIKLDASSVANAAHGCHCEVL
uniref:Protein kinase domain-containing protein n=1 Tax=Spongospora subterranea TaxID=70186 RepID=A0A0H5QLA9_9EUKA|eukprot:CRZ02146.1 hypothetical protein [Spongospora subterranea]